MSVHKSLVVRSALARARNVFSRAERLAKMTEEGKWKEGESVYGLPKLKTRAKVRKVKKEKKPAEGAEGAAPAEGAAAAPAADAKGASAGKAAAAKPAGGKK
ncbi:MAG TPA: small basic protein [Planctomycetota bacterium]|nr:small basic protein [Planctomycetota bacterium]